MARPFLQRPPFAKGDGGGFSYGGATNIQVMSVYESINIDAPVKSQKTSFSVIPAEAGIQEYRELLDPGDPVPAKAGSRGDGLEDFLRDRQY